MGSGLTYMAGAGAPIARGSRALRTDRAEAVNIIVSTVLLVSGLFWVWGALSGRLASMLGALAEPKWLVKTAAATKA